MPAIETKPTLASLPLRPFQKQAIDALKQTDHLICIAATGSGKSRIFQEYLKQHPKKNAVLVSPLKALARQHEQQLINYGIPSSQFHVISPEQIKSTLGSFRYHPDFLIVDEAHSVWEWGETFRPHFRDVMPWVKDKKIKKSLWLTATLPPTAKQDIQNHLPENQLILGQFQLPLHLDLDCRRVHSSRRVFELANHIHARKNELGIVFVETRELAEKLKIWIQPLGVNTWVYHAGLSAEDRSVLELKIKQASQGVILATSAFGMGMDIHAIRYCVLFQPPATLLSLVQALGRASRSDLPAMGLVFWHEDDFIGKSWMFKKVPARQAEHHRVLQWCQKSEGRSGLDQYFNGSS
jgi:ATP-dependent DNA helicase RecQ